MQVCVENLRPPTEPLLCKLDHCGRPVHAHEIGASADKLLAVEARATTGIQHSPAGDLAHQVEHCWAVVVRVVRAVCGVLLVVACHLVVIGVHDEILPEEIAEPS